MVSSMFMRLNANCAHHLSQPPDRLSGEPDWLSTGFGHGDFPRGSSDLCGALGLFGKPLATRQDLPAYRYTRRCGEV